jgi:hypothetical protein
MVHEHARLAPPFLLFISGVMTLGFSERRHALLCEVTKHECFRMLIDAEKSFDLFLPLCGDAPSGEKILMPPTKTGSWAQLQCIESNEFKQRRQQILVADNRQQGPDSSQQASGSRQQKTDNRNQKTESASLNC